ncbi:MAG: imelysin family protein [Croceivirga sp.]
MLNIKKISAILSLILTFACAEKPTNEAFDLESFLQDTTEGVILPIIVDFNQQATLLANSIEGYVNEPNADDISDIRAQWLATVLAYEKTYNFHFGPAKSKFLHQAIYNWPTVPKAIENTISSKDITAETMAKVSPQIKGLAALEYLLFNDGAEEIHEQLINDAKRRIYLKESANFIKSQAQRLSKIWDAEGDNYAQKFVTNKATGINSSFNLLFNGLYNAANTAKVTKIGKPGGFEKSPRSSPDRVQAPYSNTSLELTNASLKVIEDIFLSTDHANISQYISSIANDELTNERIKTAIFDIKEAITAIPVPLKQAVESHPEEVKALHEKLTALNIWMGVDARSILSIIITSTDNDGD